MCELLSELEIRRKVGSTDGQQEQVYMAPTTIIEWGIKTKK